MENGIDEFYGYKEKKKVKGSRKPYRLRVVKRTLYNKDYSNRIYKETGYKTLYLNDVVVFLKYEMYDEVFNNYSNDELEAYYGTTDIITLLNNNDECDIVNGKRTVDTKICEANFRRLVFDNANNTMKYKNGCTVGNGKKCLTDEEIKNSMNFEVANEWSKCDFNKIR